MSIIPNYVPSGFKVINVFLTVKDGQRALQWYNRAFGAEESMRLHDNDGRILHAEMKLADCTFMIAEEDLRYNLSPRALHGSSVTLQLYVPDVEGIFEEAVKMGAKILSPIEKKFYGDRSGKIEDPFGHQWILATHVEDVTAAEIQRRFNHLMDNHPYE